MENIRILHFIMYLINAYIGCIQLSVFFMSNMILVNVISYFASMFRYLTHEIKNLELIGSAMQSEREKIKVFAKTIKLHNKLLDMTRLLNECCSIFLLIYYISFTIITCLLCNEIRIVRFLFVYPNDPNINTFCNCSFKINL